MYIKLKIITIILKSNFSQINFILLANKKQNYANI